MTTARYIIGDAFQVMAGMPDGSVDLVMTSPPFYGLRSYLPDGHPDKHKEIGSEATPADYLDTLLRLTAEWGRLLAPHGSICVELGDTYAGSGGAGGDYDPDGLRDGQPKFRVDWSKSGLLPKSLCGIPDAYALSLERGWNVLRRNAPDSPAGQWRVRNKVAWVRPNPPVGALGDRFRNATSYLTIATRARDRYFDLDAVRTHPARDYTNEAPGGYREFDRPNPRMDKSRRNSLRTVKADPAGAPPLDWWNHIDTLIDDEIRTRAGKYNGGRNPQGKPISEADTRRLDAANSGGIGHGNRYSEGERTVGAQGSHIRRRLEQAGYLGGPTDDVWDITPGGFSGAHYAVYPPELCVRPILAMTPQRVCTTCGQPSRRLTESHPFEERGGLQGGRHQGNGGGESLKGSTRFHTTSTTVGWSDCGCPGTDRWRPGHVLDPFAGSGTTLAVATGHGRAATGIDLDLRNAQLALERVGMFLTVEHHTGSEVVA